MAVRESGDEVGGEAGWTNSDSHNELSGHVNGPVIQARMIAGGVHLHQRAVNVLERIPRQLPPDAALFTGRKEDLADVDRSWARAVGDGVGALLVVCGTAGVGKSALAVHWLRQHTDTFPDGHLYADLGGYSPGGPVQPQEVAGAFLRALGVDAASVPDALAERVALLRSITADRRIGVLLENPVSAAQVRTLALTGPGCATVVTARQALSGLAIDGARVHRLEPWRPETAVRLMERMLGQDRVSAEPAQALEVARLCGGLPLAVGVAGARLAARPRWPLARLAQALATDTERLQALALDEEHAVRPALDGSYRALPELQQRLYRLLGFSPLRWFDPPAAAAATGAEHCDGVEEHLDALVDASLLEELTDRYRFHDLVRVHAADCARREEPEPERAAALTRIIDFYLHTATRIESALTPSHRLLERDYQFATPVVLAFPDETTSLDWLDAQRPNLMAVLRYGAVNHRYGHTWRLAYAMWPLFLRRRYPDERLEAQTLALQAARAEGHRIAEGNLLTSLAGTLATAGRLREAAEYHRQALTVYEQLGDQRGLAQACNGLAKIHLELGELPEARHLFERARQLRAAIGYERGVYLSHQGLGRVASASGDTRSAAWHLRHAYRGLTRLSDRYDAAWSLALWAHTIAQRGQARRALRLLDRAQTMMHNAGSPYGQAGIHEIIGQIHQQTGDLVTAREHYTTAARLFAGINPHAETRLHARLTDLGGPHPESV